MIFHTFVYVLVAYKEGSKCVRVSADIDVPRFPNELVLAPRSIELFDPVITASTSREDSGTRPVLWKELWQRIPDWNRT